MPSADHEVTGIYLANAIMKKIEQLHGHPIDSVTLAGATKFQIDGLFGKEGDQCLRPRLTREVRDAWPSVMIEVGYGQGLASLQSNAITWLDKSSGRIKFVLIAKTRRDPLRIRIQCWKISSTGHRKTRQTCSEEPTLDQEFDINLPALVSSSDGSTELTIPYKCISDDIPAPHPLILSLLLPNSLLSLEKYSQTSANR